MTLVNKTKILIWLSLWLLVACDSKDDKMHIKPYDPSIPVSFDTFLPDSGGIATKMVLFGKNFGNDPSLINVYFNNKKATVVGVSDDIMYVLTPRQPGDLSDLSIVIGSDSVICEKKQFKYLLSTNVLPFAGVVDADGNGGFKDGPIGDAMFESPRFIQCDIDNNLFVSDNENRVRLVSPQLGQVITLADNIARPVGGCTSTDGKRIYVGAYVWKASANDRRVYCFDPERQWNPYVIPTGIPADDVDWVSSIAIDEDDVIYLGAENGNLFKVDTKNDEWSYLQENATRNGDYVYVAYSRIDRRVYVATRDESRIYYYDLRTNEFNFLAGSSKGHNDGPGDEAQFNTIGQIAVDLDGNLIVADRSNHVIRMVRPDGFTSTIAGVPGQEGYLNGLPENSLFNDPYGVCVSPDDGAIYVSDKNNFRIRKIVIE